MHAFELTDQLVAADALEQVARGADPHRLEQVLLVVVHRQQDHLLGGIAVADLPAQVQPAGALHPHVT